MDVEDTTLDTAKSITSDVLISESCVENLISRLDSYEIPTSEKLCNKPQPSSVSIPDQKPDQQICQEKEPVEQTSISSKCSIKVGKDFSQNSSHEKSTESLKDMDVEDTTLDTAKSITSDVLISESCVENLISRLDSYEIPTSEKLCNKPQPSSVSIPDQKPDQQICQEKEPVEQTSISSRCSIKVGKDFSQNSSHDSTKSTVVPLASQKSSSGFTLSKCGNPIKWDFPGSNKRIKKSLNYQQTVKNVPEPTVMKQIKLIHNHLNFCLKNSKVIKQADKILLTNAKQQLFSLKQRHAVLCDSIKTYFNQQIPTDKSRQVLKKRVNLLQKRQQQLLLLFQEHNVITKKIKKMLNSEQSKQLEMTLKQCLLPSSKLMDNPLLGLGKTEKISKKTVTAFDDTQSESLSTVYSIGSLDASQRTKSKDWNYFSLSQTQEPTYKSFKTPNKIIKSSINNFPDNSQIVDSEPNPTQCYNVLSQASLLNNKSTVCSDWIAENSTNMLNDFSLNPLSKQLTDHQQFTATPIGTTADFTKVNSDTQQSFDNPFPSEVTACPDTQNLKIASQVSQNIAVHSRDDLHCTSINVLIAKKVESQKQISDDDLTNEDNLEETWSDENEENLEEEKAEEASSQISTSLTHLTLVEDEELIPLYSILPSCQNTDPFGSINFPKFLWDGFHKWP